MGEDVDNICRVRMICRQIMQDDPNLLVNETRKDPVLPQVMRCVKEGWPNQYSDKLLDYMHMFIRNWMTPYPLNMVANFMC